MHIERQKRRHEHRSDFAEIRRTCATIRREYEHSYGRIIDIYVCRHLSHAGVVLTGYELRSRIRGLLEPGLREGGPRVKIATDIKVRYPPEKVVGLQPHFAETLWRAGTLSREARTVLGGKRATHILQRIFNVIQLLLEILDSQESLDENGSDGAHLPDRRPAPDARLQRLNQTLEEANAELDEVQWLLRTWAGRTAEKTYVLGMPIGLLFIILLAVVYARTNVESIDQELLIVSLVGGALGAMVSVMTRISRNKLKVDPYADRLFIVLCGAFRPIVGAVVAVVVQCALQADALPVKPPTDPSVEKYLALMLAFAVGFSERWAQDMLRRTAGELGVRGHPKKEKAAGAADREATADAADSI